MRLSLCFQSLCYVNIVELVKLRPARLYPFAIMQNKKATYRLIDHTADLGMEIFGEDTVALFINAGKALFETIVTPVADGGRIPHQHTVVLEGDDWADLMVNWLRELLYLWHGAQQIAQDFSLNSISEHRLLATVKTCDYSDETHRIETEIKAVTYHQIEVAPYDDGWRARVIFDV